MIITIDGPSGTGKSTVARRVAERLHLTYFDTGAMYRAFTWEVLQKKVDLSNRQMIVELLSDFEFSINEVDGTKRYFLKDEDITDIIRSRLVTAHVSAVAALKEVRDSLLVIQHRFASKHDSVFEGRDLGTVVFPLAEVKIFLTADPVVRAERRLAEILQKNPAEGAHLNREEMLAELMKRDELDSTREVAPLRCPEDAYRIDTTHMTIEEVVDTIANYTHKKIVL